MKKIRKNSCDDDFKTEWWWLFAYIYKRKNLQKKVKTHKIKIQNINYSEIFVAVKGRN